MGPLTGHLTLALRRSCCIRHPRSVLGGLAATVYGDPSDRMTVVGITGTSGKTTTAYMVEAGLRAGGRVAGLIGTIGIRIDGADIPGTLTTPEVSRAARRCLPRWPSAGWTPWSWRCPVTR